MQTLFLDPKRFEIFVLFQKSKNGMKRADKCRFEPRERSRKQHFSETMHQNKQFQFDLSLKPIQTLVFILFYNWPLRTCQTKSEFVQ